MKPPIVWETHPCHVCGREYYWPQGVELPKLETCGKYDCVHKAVIRERLAHQGMAQFRAGLQEKAEIEKP